MQKKFKFSLGVNYLGCTVEEEVEFEFDDSIDEDEISDIVNEEYRTWIENHNRGGWIEIN
jgi:hypothetical protein